MLLLAQFGTLAGFLMLAFSGSMTMLFASRVVDGIFGGNFPIAKAIIGDVVPPKDRSEQMSNIGVAHVLSSLIGPGLGGLLSRWGIIAPGLLSSGLTLITITMTARYLRETNPVADQDAEVGEVFRNPFHSLFAGGLEIVRNNETTRYLLIQWGFHTLSFMTYVSTLSLFANLKLGLNPQEVGLLLMISGVVRVFNRFVIFVPLLHRLGDRRTSLLGLGLFVVIFFLLGFVRTRVQFALVLSAASFAASCTRGVLNGFISRSVGPGKQGRAMGLSASLDSFAQIVGPLVGGIILGSFPLWMYGGLASLFAALAFVMAFRQFELRDEREPSAV
jgi:DHA1 family tetracycline resistance protein-like MFS transporter